MCVDLSGGIKHIRIFFGAESPVPPNVNFSLPTSRPNRKTNSVLLIRLLKLCLLVPEPYSLGLFQKQVTSSVLEKMKCHFTRKVCKKILKDNEFDRHKVGNKLFHSNCYFYTICFSLLLWVTGKPQLKFLLCFFNDLAITIIGNGNRNEWSTIQGVIGRVIYALGRFEITSTITPELYDTKSYYQLIVPITKCGKLRNEIFNASA